MPFPSTRKFLRLLSTSIMLALVPVPALAREKIDVIILHNGDKVTGEIKELTRGRLRVSTNYMDTVLIEWDEIKSITSPQRFEVEVSSGARFVGSIPETSETGTIAVASAETTLDLEQPLVVYITQLDEGFWDRLDATVDLGFSVTRANRAQQFTLGSEVSYRTLNYLGRATFESLLTDREDSESSTRNDLSINLQRFFPNRWFAAALTQFTRNKELGLDLRSLMGAAAGRELVQTNRTKFSVFGGAGFTRERFIADTARHSAEAVLGLRHELFTWGQKETDITTTVIAFPSLSDLGRLRVEFNTRIRWEIFKDFFWSASAFDSFDSQPPAEDVERNDFGISSSFGWKF